MFRRLFFILWMVLFILPVTSGMAQSNQPVITAFTSSSTSVDRAALQNRTARVPVRWSTAHRPLAANLIFEQVLPDNTSINVELPRLNPWVNSSGDGIAAPILPTGGANTIRLRVRLVNFLTQFVYDTKEITLLINTGGNDNGSNTTMPTITAFTTPFSGAINRVELANGTARIPVSWAASNRPLTANLIFDQVMPDGRSINVELPRTSPWVNSADKGVVAPITPTPGATPTEIRLRVRLVDMVYGRIYDQRDLVLPIDATPPPSTPPAGKYISAFTTTLVNVGNSELLHGALIPVTWALTNRPANTNLVFEQIMTDGTFRNAELPRDVLIVPSSGSGTMQVFQPGGAIIGTSVKLQVRLLDLATGTTLDTQYITLPVVNNNVPPDNSIEVTGDKCYQTPFPAANGLAIGKTGKILTFSNGASLSVFSTKRRYDLAIGEFKVNETFTVLEGPVCVITAPNVTPQITVRQWRVKDTDSALEGWISEYSGNNTDGFIKQAAATDVQIAPPVEIVTFTVTPPQLALNGNVTITWEVRNSNRILINAGAKSYDNQPASGTMTLLMRDIFSGNSPLIFTIYTTDTQQNWADKQVSLPVAATVTLNSLSAAPNPVVAGQAVTLTWDIAGTFTQAGINWTPRTARPTIVPVTTITTNTGSFNFTLPDFVRGDYVFTLWATDSAGVTIYHDSNSITINCPVIAFFVSDPVIQNGRCATAAAAAQNAAYQPFERGFMVWYEWAGTRFITAFFNDGTVSSPSYDGSTATPPDTPPAGLFVPINGFGAVWQNNPALRNGLGWATAPEQGYSATSQSTRTYERYETAYLYLTLPDGRTVRLAIGSQPGWVFVG